MGLEGFSVKSEGFLELDEVGNTDDGTFIEENLEDVIVIEDLDNGKKVLLGGNNVKALDKKSLTNNKAQNLIDDLHTSRLANAGDARFNTAVF